MAGHRRALTFGLGAASAALAIVIAGTTLSGEVARRAGAGVAGLAEAVPWTDVTWERVDPPSMGGPLGQRPVDIERIPGGLVVVGQDADGVEGAQREVGAVWVSTDGRSWDQHLMLDVPAGDVAELRLAAGGPAGLLVMGGVCCSVEEPAAWLASSGLAFERVGPPGPNATVMDVEAGPGGFVAVGATWVGDPNDPDHTAAIWSSPDGRDWVAVDDDAAGLERGWANDVLWTGSDWFAVGTADDGETSDGTVWRSDDGLTWERLAIADPAITGPDEESLARVLPLGSGLFAQGSAGSHEDRQRCEDLLGAGAGVVGVEGATLSLSCGWGVTTHWTSSDGRSWTRSPAVEGDVDGPLPPGPGGRRLVSHRVLAAGGPGLVAVDAEGTTPDGFDLVGSWVSPDGASWRPVGEAGAFEDGMVLQDLVVVDRTLVGVAEGPFDAPTGTDIVVWIGSVRP
jgi:hypothetical protein